MLKGEQTLSFLIVDTTIRETQDKGLELGKAKALDDGIRERSGALI